MNIIWFQNRRWKFSIVSNCLQMRAFVGFDRFLLPVSPSRGSTTLDRISSNEFLMMRFSPLRIIEFLLLRKKARRKRMILWEKEERGWFSSRIIDDPLNFHMIFIPVLFPLSSSIYFLYFLFHSLFSSVTFSFILFSSVTFFLFRLLFFATCVTFFVLWITNQFFFSSSNYYG